jgi:hypothetical protein
VSWVFSELATYGHKSNRNKYGEQEENPMLTDPKNKAELIDCLRQEKDFKVIKVIKGKASDLSKSISVLGGKTVAVIVIESR